MESDRSLHTHHFCPRSSMDPDYKRACENGKTRQQRNGVQTRFANCPQLALSYLRYIIAGEAAGAWKAFGGMGAMLSHLAHLQKVAMTQNAETSFRFERAQSAKSSQLARNRGGPTAFKNDLRIFNRESLAQCASDQLAESTEREKSYELTGREGSAVAREAVAESRRLAAEKRQGPTARDCIAELIGTKRKMKVKNTQTTKKTKKRKAIRGLRRLNSFFGLAIPSLW